MIHDDSGFPGQGGPPGLPQRPDTTGPSLDLRASPDVSGFESTSLQRVRSLVCPPDIELPAPPAIVPSDPEPEKVPLTDSYLAWSPQATSIAQDALYINSELFNGYYSRGEELRIPLNVGLFQPWTQFNTAADMNTINWESLATNPDLDTTSVEDIFRFRARKCWTYIDNELIWTEQIDYAQTPVFQIRYSEMTAADQNPSNWQPVNNFPSGPFADLAASQKMTIVADEMTLQTYFNGNRELFRKYLFGGFNNGFKATIPQDPNRVYYDSPFQISLPFSDRFAKRHPDIKNILVFNSFNRYNYYIRRYEDRTEDLAIPENVLPNIYTWLSFIEYLRRERTGVNLFSDLYNIISLNGALNNNFLVKDTPTGPDLKLNLGLFDAFSLLYPQEASTREAMENFVARKQTNLLMLPGDVEFLTTANGVNNASLQKKNNFPMYIEMNFRTPDSSFSEFAGALSRFEHDMPLFKEVIQSLKVGEDNRVRGLDDEGNQIQNGEVYGLKNYHKIIKGAEIIPEGTEASSDLGALFLNESLREWDLNKWLRLFGKNGQQIFDQINDDIITFLGFSETNNGSVFLNSDDQWSSIVERKFFSAALRTKIKSLVREHNRSWREVMAGKKAHSETIFYRIEKSVTSSSLAGAQRAETKIQDFYLMNSPDVDILQWLDTQVKHGKTYRYKIYAYQAVFGTKYQYVRRTAKVSSFKVNYEPCLKLVEVLFHEFENVIMDSPPCQPVAEVFPYRGRSDKICFFLQDNPGRTVQYPISFNDAEEDMYDAVRRSQELPEGHPIMFRSDDRIESFLVYRSLEKPRGYTDFRDKLISEVFTVIERRNYEHLCSLKVGATAFVDEGIQPNTKYYYMFRSRDVHGHLSNPSPVFEIELIDTIGCISPVIDIIEFPIEETNYIKSARKYIYISPSINQLQLSELTANTFIDKQVQLDSGNYTDLAAQMAGITPEIGDREHPIWDGHGSHPGQKFKIRLTSKATGRKIEFNVKFKHTHEPTSNIEVCYEDPQVDPETINDRLRDVSDEDSVNTTYDITR